MANLKISQVEKTQDMDTDAYVLVVQNGKNYRMSIKEAIAANVDIDDVDLSNYYTKSETTTIINDAIEDFKVVSDEGNVTTITEVVNTVETQTEKIVELETTTESQAEQIIQLENIVQNINKDVATEEDAEASFDDIFSY
jgi:YesN/AraC family two-component response regulator